MIAFVSTIKKNPIFFYFERISLMYGLMISFIFFFKQKTAYEIMSGDWSSDVCSADLQRRLQEMLDRDAAAEGMLGRDETGEGYIKLNYFNRMRDTISRVVPHLPEEPVHPFFHERNTANPKRCLLYTSRCV